MSNSRSKILKEWKIMSIMVATWNGCESASERLGQVDLEQSTL